MRRVFALRLKGQEFHDLGDAGDRRDKARIDHVDFLHAARLECADQLRRELLCVACLRTLADADALVHDVKAAILEEITRLAPDRNDLRIRLVLDERHRRLEGVTGIRTREAFVRRHHEDEAFAARVLLKQRMRDAACRRRDTPNDRRGLFGVGRIVVCGLLGTAQTRGRDHVHGVCDLLDALDAADAATDVL